MWALALDAANARLSAEREALDVVRGEAEAARREAVEMADSLAVELENAQAALSAQAGELERAKAENGRLTAEIAAVKESGREAVEYARRQAKPKT